MATTTKKTRKTSANPAADFMAWAEANPTAALAMVKGVKRKAREERNKPGLHPEPLSGRNMVAKCTYVKHVKLDGETIVIRIEAGVVRTNGDTGCRISASVGGIFGVQGDTFPGTTIEKAAKLAMVAEAEKANAMPTILKHLQTEWRANVGKVAYTPKPAKGS